MNNNGPEKLSDPFTLKVMEFVKKAEAQGFIPVKAVAGDGVIIVQDSRDSKSEFDTYFDKTKWEFVMPKVWEGSGGDASVGILPGVGIAPRVQNMEEAMEFAHRELKSKGNAILYKEPKLLS